MTKDERILELEDALRKVDAWLFLFPELHALNGRMRPEVLAALRKLVVNLQDHPNCKHPNVASVGDSYFKCYDCGTVASLGWFRARPVKKCAHENPIYQGVHGVYECASCGKRGTRGDLASG